MVGNKFQQFHTCCLLKVYPSLFALFCTPLKRKLLFAHECCGAKHETWRNGAYGEHNEKASAKMWRVNIPYNLVVVVVAFCSCVVNVLVFCLNYNRITVYMRCCEFELLSWCVAVRRFASGSDYLHCLAEYTYVYLMYGNWNVFNIWTQMRE